LSISLPLLHSLQCIYQFSSCMLISEKSLESSKEQILY
jgi:hypothetical protein